MKNQVLKIGLIWELSLVTAFLFICFTTPCQAAFDSTLEWDEHTELEFDHYEIFTREEAQSYDYNDPLLPSPPDATNYNFNGLDDNITYCFVVRAVGEIDGEEVESRNSREVCILAPNSLGPDYNRGWAITSGDLKGFAVSYFYDDADPDPSPTLGPSSAIPDLHDEFPNIYGVGVPLNLQPSPAAFSNPVRISIPCPGYSNVSALDVYHYDGSNWVLADDTWMILGSRVNHNGGDPSAIEIQVYRFSGVQAGATSYSNSSSGGGCFVVTAAFGSNLECSVHYSLVLVLFGAFLYSLAILCCRLFRRTRHYLSTQ